MNAINAFGNAALGWLDLLASRPGGAERFDISRAGLITALVYYFVIVAGLTIVDLAVFNTLTYDRIFVGVVFNTLPLLLVVGIALLTMRLLKPDVPANILIVPVVYAMGYRALLGVALGAAFGPLVSFTLLGVLGYMLYRGARDLPKLGIGISVAYAFLNIAALVGLAEALHMLLA